MEFTKYVNRKTTPQSEPVVGREEEMEKNAAGGYTFTVDKWQRLRRFLILGSEGGTYYIGERTLTKDNANIVLECIAEDPAKASTEVAFVSSQGLAPKNDPAIFALALGASAEMTGGMPDGHARGLFLSKLKSVCRTPTHLFQFAHYVSAMRGWGKGLRSAISDWYLSKDVGHLGYQMQKYKSRKVEGEAWTHADLLSKAHVKPGDDPMRRALFRWAAAGLDTLDEARSVTRRRHDGTTGASVMYDAPGKENLPEGILAMRELELMAAGKWTSASTRKVLDAVGTYGLTREMLPTQALNQPDVWEALLEKMPATALIRNLGKMTAVGVLEQLSNGTAKAVEKLSDHEWLRKSRIHPMNVLVAMKTYAAGEGVRGKLTWNPVPQIVDALDGAFYGSFEFVEPTGKKTVYALDVSGSMSQEVSGYPLTCAEVSACFAMVLMRCEPQYAIVGFNRGLVNLGISPKMRLVDVVNKVHGLTYEGTDCSLPARFAREKEVRDLEAIVIITDNETWAGGQHPYQALEEYRRWSGVPTRQIVLATTATSTTIADPRDKLSLDIAGFDLSVPQIVSGFMKGEL